MKWYFLQIGLEADIGTIRKYNKISSRTPKIKNLELKYIQLFPLISL